VSFYVTESLAFLRTALAGRYTIEREIPGGGMATVYLARDLKNKRPVALKVLSPELAFSATRTERFLREIDTTARLDHPFILAVLESGAVDDQPWYTMPYVRGESLRDRLNREKRLPTGDAIRITREVADALDYAHRSGVVHRDIKPDNVLLSDGHARVADFGVARAIEAGSADSLTGRAIVGTLAYISPEQAGGDRVDGRADLYALGCVLYEMLAGSPPFVRDTAQAYLAAHLTATPPAIETARPDAPPEVRTAIARALAKDPADRFATGAEFRDALIAVAEPHARHIPRHTRIALVGAAVVVIVGVAALLFRHHPQQELDPNLVAVAPFDVLDPHQELWHEGLVDVLSRNLDGAGPLRTVPPTVVIRRWSGHADPASATDLSRRTGAGLVIFGNLIGAGTDTVRLDATVFDAASGHARPDVVVSGKADRMDQVVDSLTMAVLRELGRTRAIGAVRLASLGSSSLPAIKSFLRAEQFYRSGQWDSSLAYAQRAEAIDSSFTLALRLIPQSLWWGNTDTIVNTYLLREGAHNRGLAPRESLLVTLDSLWGALRPDDLRPWPLLRRLFTTAEEATRRYPDDPEVWYLRGELGFHHNGMEAVPLTDEQVIESFERAIGLDPEFAPAYVHAVDLALRLRSPATAHRYLAVELGFNPRATTATSLHVTDRLLVASEASSPAMTGALDTLSGDALSDTWFNVVNWPDSAETAVRIARQFAKPRNGFRAYDSTDRGWVMPTLALTYRGHLREAYFSLQGGDPASFQGHFLFTQLSAAGGIPHDSLAARFEHWRKANDWWAGTALGWWASAGDSESIRDYARRAAALKTGGKPQERDIWRYWAAAAEPYLALIRHDTTAALREFAILPDSLCAANVWERLRRVQLLDLRHDDRVAAALLEQELISVDSPLIFRVFWALERGRVYERLRRRDKAIAAYEFVADVWRNADPELQPYVREAKAALVRLGGERGTALSP